MKRTLTSAAMSRVWQCVAGAALVVGTLSAVQAAVHESRPPMVERSQSTVQPHDGEIRHDDGREYVYLLAGSGLLAIGGVITVGGVVSLGGLRIPGGVAMTVARVRLWSRGMRATGAHRAGRAARGRRR